MKPSPRLRRRLAVLPLLIAAPAAQAQSVAKVDPRALAMGGGYVAVADGWAALQWNPAGMWVSGRYEAAGTFGDLPLEAGPWVESLRVAAGVSSALAPVEAATTLQSDDAGLAGERAMGVYFVSPRFGGAFQQITYVNQMQRGLLGEEVIEQAVLRTRGYQLSVAQPLLQGQLVLGASFKAVQMQGRWQALPPTALSPSDLDSGRLLSEARSAAVVGERTVFSVDVGMLVMATAKFRVGAVVKNLNAPSLQADATVAMHLPRQIRLGGLLLPHPQLKLAFDLDLYTDSFVDGMRERRELGGGLEWKAGGLALRGGLFVDLGAIERRSTYTFGVGVGGQVLRFDVGGSWAPQRDGFGWMGALAAEF